MSDFNQRKQTVNTQYNIVVQQNGTTIKKTLRNIRTDYRWGVGGSQATVEFTLDHEHIVTYKRDEPNIIMLFVDGQQVFRRSVFNPIGRIEYAFQIESIDCQLICQFIVLGVNVSIRVAGHEILSV